MFDRLKGPVMTVIPRVGTGVDVHAFGEEGTPLYVAGLHWPGERGLSGHSDGDVLLRTLFLPPTARGIWALISVWIARI